MNASEFPSPNQGGLSGGVNSQIEVERAKAMVVRNSRFLIGLTLLGSIFSAFLAVCMVFVVISDIFPVSQLNASRGMSAAEWAASSLCFAYMCTWTWAMGWKMASMNVKLDTRGVDFNLGTKKKPVELFMPWEQVSAIKQKRVGNAQQFTVQGSDGSYAQFSSYTFFRPKKVARLIAERTGLAIQKA